LITRFPPITLNFKENFEESTFSILQILDY
jgi:hypothetical protein